MFDAIIIGAGPAGLTAAIYLLRENKKIKIFEKETVGGKITSSSRVDNYPGIVSISGAALAEQMVEQLEALGGVIEIEEVKEITKNPLKVITDEGEYLTKTIIIATGTKYNTLNLDNEKDFIGNGISFCTTCDGAFYKDKTVAVVGGSFKALIDAIYLSDIAQKVYLIVRKNYLKGEKVVIEELQEKKNVEILYETEVVEYLGSDSITGIVIKEKDKKRTLELDGIFLAIGQIPETKEFTNIDLDENNYIKATENCKTNVPGIFVAGDVRSKNIRQLTTSVSDGTIAAMNVIQFLKEEI